MKNKVKLNRQYKEVGKIPVSAVGKIKEYIDFPKTVRTIRANTGNYIKHNNKHIDEIDEKLSDLGITKEGYIGYVAQNYNQIRLGNSPLSLVIVVSGDELNHMAAIHLYYDKNEHFWLVTSVHAIREKDLEKMRLIWEK